ncbi:MAG: ATP synthase F0 subunit C [Syntrophorhabdaceae bacterium]|nr:ATP synthase F0 subunit C [Syntrophorhabdaceae bacterium]
MKKLLSIIMLLGLFVCFSVSVALAAEEAKGLDPSVKQMVALAAGFGVAIAAFGGALGQARGIASALDGIARNPGASGKIVTPMIIGLAMIESLVIYSLVVSLLLIFKL